MKNKVVVIGCGKVGMAYIYAIVNQLNLVSEIVMIDKDADKLEGERLDLCHTLNYSLNSIVVRVGDYQDCKDASIVVITAGIPQSENDRLNDLKENKKIFDSILEQVLASGFKGIFLVASNPLDVMTYYVMKKTGFPSERVLGSGTSLDSSRLVYMLSEKLHVSPKSIEAYVIGEHGNSSLVAWSSASVANQSLSEFLTKEDMDFLEEEVHQAAYKIIKRKGSTYYGIAMALVRITNAILKDEKVVLPVSNYDAKNDVYISTLCVLGKNGIEQRIYMKLDTSEEEKLQNSIEILKRAIASIE